MECEKELIAFGKNDNEDEERKERGREGMKKKK